MDEETEGIIKEIAEETIFDYDTAKYFYLRTGDKAFCIRLAELRAMGGTDIALETLTRAYLSAKVNLGGNKLD